MKCERTLYKTIYRTLSNKRKQIIIFTIGSLFINLSYATYNSVLGVIQKSVWFITMGVYYSILSMMRLIAVKGEYRQDKKSQMTKEIGIMKTTGIMLESSASFYHKISDRLFSCYILPKAICPFFCKKSTIRYLFLFSFLPQ